MVLDPAEHPATRRTWDSSGQPVVSGRGEPWCVCGADAAIGHQTSDIGRAD